MPEPEPHWDTILEQRAEIERDGAVKLLEEALHLRMNGERAPGGDETWADWDRRTEMFLRGLLPAEASSPVR